MSCDLSPDRVSAKVLDGERIDNDEALVLYRSLPLTELGLLADARRQQKKARAYDGRGNQVITYIVDRNINYTNICNVNCKFCAFYRIEGESGGYVLSNEEIGRKIEELIAAGGTQILLQGGHHPKLGLEYYTGLLSFIKTNYPQVNIHGFSPPEFVHFKSVFGLPIPEIIAQFKAAGLGSIPGGGAEILVDRVRKRIAPLKCSTAEWLGVMKLAHEQGLSSSATMMFGHVESVEQRIEHLQRLRELQDQTAGFTAFICWTFQAEHTKLRAPTVGAHEYLRTQALARIYLDNFENIQASWVTQGPTIGQLALKFGANDFGGLMMEENVVSSAGTAFKVTLTELKRLIAELGYEPHQRDNWYRLLN